jgi:pantetheine-phosphate adenylyltransferase
LESACDAIARVAPVLEFTPLLMELGWDEKSARARADALARPSNEVVVDDADDATKKKSGAAFRDSGDSGDSFLRDERRPTDPTNVGSRGGFAKVSVGGTFDRLHAGHRLLLAAAALVTDARSGTLYVGVTGEALLANKSDKNKIQPYETRARNARRFLESVLPGHAKMRVEMGPLDGAPPLASTVQDMCALVVSRETLAGAAAVNAQREARGFPPLEIVATGVVGGVGDDDESRRRSKLSSSALRAAAE